MAAPPPILHRAVLAACAVLALSVAVAAAVSGRTSGSTFVLVLDALALGPALASAAAASLARVAGHAFGAREAVLVYFGLWAVGALALTALALYA